MPGNASCHRDGTPTEDVIWAARTGSTGQPVSPIIPPGVYVVRVDTHSLCGAPGASWHVEVYRAGALLAAARGSSSPDEVLLPHRAGAGVTALRFTLP